MEFQRFHPLQRTSPPQSGSEVYHHSAGATGTLTCQTRKDAPHALCAGVPRIVPDLPECALRKLTSERIIGKNFSDSSRKRPGIVSGYEQRRIVTYNLADAGEIRRHNRPQ